MTTVYPPKITIIIPNRNGFHYLKFCLASIYKQTYPHFEVILVDNGSTDNSIRYVMNTFPLVQILACPDNLGFAKANNIAIQATNAPYIATLNNDTIVNREWLTEMFKGIENHSQVGMIACKILSMKHPSIIESAGVDIDQVGMAISRYHGLPNNYVEKKPYEVFFPCAAGALYKREMFNQIGLFDETFFAYCEDMDLGWRARLMGWRCLYVPTAIVYHYHSGTSQQGSPFKRYLLTRNRIWTVIKNYPFSDLWRDIPKLILYDFMAMIYRLLLEKNLSPINGRLAAIKRLKEMYRKRYLFQSSWVASFDDLEAMMPPPINHIQRIIKNNKTL